MTNMKKNVAFVCICWYCMSMIETETKLKQSSEDIAPWHCNPCDCRYQVPRSTCILADRLYCVLLIRLRFEEETMDERDYPHMEDVPHTGLGWNVAVQWYFGTVLVLAFLFCFCSDFTLVILRVMFITYWYIVRNSGNIYHSASDRCFEEASSHSQAAEGEESCRWGPTKRVPRVLKPRLCWGFKWELFEIVWFCP